MELLQLAGDRIVVPEAVALEVAAHSDRAAAALQAQNWLNRVKDSQIPPSLVAWDLGPGESGVLAWSMAHPGSIAILDDYAARNCADVLGVAYVGTLGLALRAKKTGRVAVARPLVEELRQAGLYLSDQLIDKALSLVGE